MTALVEYSQTSPVTMFRMGTIFQLVANQRVAGPICFAQERKRPGDHSLWRWDSGMWCAWVEKRPEP